MASAPSGFLSNLVLATDVFTVQNGKSALYSASLKKLLTALSKEVKDYANTLAEI
jgi:hypothetical protein